MFASENIHTYVTKSVADEMRSNVGGNFFFGVPRSSGVALYSGVFFHIDKIT